MCVRASQRLSNSKAKKTTAQMRSLSISLSQATSMCLLIRSKWYQTWLCVPVASELKGSLRWTRDEREKLRAMRAIKK
jgi:hypothetical protein